MSAVKILVDVQCTQPSWACKNPESFHPSYRLYLNKDLVCERSWIFGNDNLIIEEIYVFLIPDIQYKLELEPVIKIPGQANFVMTNFVSPEREHVILSNDDLHVSFKIR